RNGIRDQRIDFQVARQGSNGALSEGEVRIMVSIDHYQGVGQEVMLLELFEHSVDRPIDVVHRMQVAAQLGSQVLGKNGLPVLLRNVVVWVVGSQSDQE